MIILLNKKKLMLSAFVIITLFFLVYVDVSQRTQTFFKTTLASGVKTVILDAGHGGEDPGAVSDLLGLKEKDLNLKIVLEVKKLLETENFKVLLTRSEDILKYEPATTNIVKKRKQDLETRRKLIDNSSADIVVSVHLNKFPEQQYAGAQVFYPPNFPESKKLGEALQLKIREMVDPTNKREALVKKEPIIILKNAKVTTAIVECGFLSNPEEEAKLNQEEYQKKIALAIRHGIQHYFDSKAVSVVTD